MGDHLQLRLTDGRWLHLWVDDDQHLRAGIYRADGTLERQWVVDARPQDPPLGAVAQLKVWATDQLRSRSRALYEPHAKSDTVPIWRADVAAMPGYAVWLGGERYEVGEDCQPGDLLYRSEDGKLRRHRPSR